MYQGIKLERQIKVRLTTNLTKYHSSLVIGTEGVTAGHYGSLSRSSDQFINVRFPQITLDILCKSIEIIDQEFLEELELQKKEKLESLNTAKNVVHVVGPRGGLKYFSYEYTGKDGVNHRVSTDDRENVKEIIVFLKQQGIEIKKELLK